MREIKFRGKSVSNGDWVYGDLITYESGEKSILKFKFSKYGHEATEIINRTKIDPETVGQYTGFKDVSGNEIYEGDHLKYRIYTITVGYSEILGCFMYQDGWCFYDKWKDEGIALHCNTLSGVDLKLFKIVSSEEY